jgi:hypothetical protein
MSIFPQYRRRLLAIEFVFVLVPLVQETSTITTTIRTTSFPGVIPWYVLDMIFPNDGEDTTSQ